MKKTLTHMLLDAALIAATLYISFWLRVGEDVHTIYWPVFLKFLALYLIVWPPIFYFTGIYRMIWRFVTADDAARLGRTILIASGALLAITFLVEIRQLPRSVFIIEILLSMMVLMGARLARRLDFERSSKRAVKKQGVPTLIYGAGSNGRTLAKRLMTDQLLRSHVVGFIDDDPEKIGRNVEGIKVLGSGSLLKDLIQAYGIKQVVLAMAETKGDKLKEILHTCRKFNIKPLMMSLRDNRSPELTREIELKDLLNRPQRLSDFTSIKKMIEGKRVLVTGGGGSIGSELSRQILSFAPNRLLLLDHSEFNLYKIDQELRVNPQDTQIVTPLLLDVKDEVLLRNVFKKYQPEIVFHAAAYKHVHIVEANPHSTILNNVLGTKNLLDLCEEHNVETTVLISTDKAVNPAGVMGATKRVCELMIAAKGLKTSKRFCAVRFGNVLGSSGSLIPLLRQQILNGEPVTITHENMTRYFMLIPEAVSLVLNAATLSAPGDLQVLKMGEPVKIVDIARSLITLMGKTEEEAPIHFIGMRPGEKMFEELYINGNELETKHPDVLTVPRGDNLPTTADPVVYAQNLENQIEALIQAAYAEKSESLFMLNQLALGQQNTTRNQTSDVRQN